MNSSGGGRTRLTNTGQNTFPAWSPDGTRISFTSDRDGNREIYVMNSDGSGQTNLTKDPADDRNPAWQPAWRGIWPQDSREEGERAQAAADGGGGHYAWQLGPDGEEVVLRYVREQLGWVKPRPLDIEVPEDATGWLRQWRVIRCAPGAQNADYPQVDCAPPDGRTYPAVYITVERLLRRDDSGLWIVTAVEPTAVDQPEPASLEEVKGFVNAFLERRLTGSGVEEFLSTEAETEFREGLSLGPLYDPGYERHEIVFVDGPLWPFAGFEVGVRMHLVSGGAISETLFVGPGTNLLGQERSLAVLGGRSGLIGP